MAGAFGIYYGLNRLSDYLDTRQKNNEGNTTTNLWLIRLVSIVSSIITMVINILLDMVIRLLSSFEKHRTYTLFHLSVAIKLMTATFINSAMLPLLTNLAKKNWFLNNGLAMTIFFNVISISFVSTIFYFFNIAYYIKKLRICWEIRKGAESKMTQRQANELFEGPKLDMAALYSRTGMLFLLVCFYTPLVPIIPIIAACGVFVQYWVEKYLLLRRHKVPVALGSSMATFYTSMVPLGMLLYGIGNYVFLDKVSDKKNTHGQWSMWFMVAYYVLPVGILIDAISMKVKRDASLKYSEAKFTFVQDYDRENPMTENQAKAEYLKELRKKAKNENDAAEIDKQLAKAENA